MEQLDLGAPTTSVVGATSPIVGPTSTGGTFEHDTRRSNTGSTATAKVREDLFFQAQRRSAEHHLGEYLGLRNKIWADILTTVTASENGSLDGNHNALSQDVWRWIVTKDQLQSDLLIMNHQLEDYLHNSRRKMSFSFQYLTIFTICTDIERSLSYGPTTRYIRPVIWLLLGSSVAKLLYNGLGLAVAIWLKRLLAVTRVRLEKDKLLDQNRKDLSGWRWRLLQFSNAF